MAANRSGSGCGRGKLPKLHGLRRLLNNKEKLAVMVSWEMSFEMGAGREAQ
jgi:hypothetical protein